MNPYLEPLRFKVKQAQICSLLVLGLLGPTSCNFHEPGQLSMQNPSSESSSESEVKEIDPIPPGFDEESDPETNTEVPQANPNGNDPAGDVLGMLAAVAVEKHIFREILKIEEKEKYTTSQIKLIEIELSKLRKAGKTSKAELEKIRSQVESNINFVKDYKPPGIFSNFTMIKCKGCKTQMRSDQRMLNRLEGKINIFGGPWRDCDKYGNDLPNSPVYPTVKDCFAAQPNIPAFHVPYCIYCYKDNDIASAERKIDNQRREYEDFSEQYTKYAHQTNEARYEHKSLKTKERKVNKKIADYKATIAAYKEAAEAVECLREKEIIDYEALSYEDNRYDEGCIY